METAGGADFGGESLHGGHRLQPPVQHGFLKVAEQVVVDGGRRRGRQQTAGIPFFLLGVVGVQGG